MESNLDLDELVANWTLVGDEVDLVAGKRGPTRLRFALLLKFYGGEGHFDVDAGSLGQDWSERTGRFHQAQIRDHFGFRVCSTDDADRAVAWLAMNVCEGERGAAVVHGELLAWFRREHVEPPTAGRIERGLLLWGSTRCG